MRLRMGKLVHKDRLLLPCSLKSSKHEENNLERVLQDWAQGMSGTKNEVLNMDTGRRHSIQHNDIQHTDTQHTDTQHTDTPHNIKNATFSILTL
jgi:hypothetical protein